MSPRLTDLVRAASSPDRLYVTGPHSEWMERPEEEQVYSKEAIEHVQLALSGAYKVNRVGRFSPSGIGKCPRALAYGYAGAPQAPFDAELVEIMDNGTWLHLKWQAEGLSAGYMSKVEAWVEDKDLLIGGSVDAILSDGSVFELKSAAPSVFNRIVLDQGSAGEENLMQADTYMMLLGASHTSVVYEDRAYGNFHEFREPADADRERRIVKRLKSLKSMVENDELPEPYDDCVMKVGKRFKGCPYRKVCHKLDTVSAAQEAGGHKEGHQWQD